MTDYFDIIMRELSYRVPDGIPDLNNSAHLLKLQEILTESGWNKRSISKLIKSLKGMDVKNVPIKEKVLKEEKRQEKTVENEEKPLKDEERQEKIEIDKSSKSAKIADIPEGK